MLTLLLLIICVILVGIFWPVIWRVVAWAIGIIFFIGILVAQAATI